MADFYFSGGKQNAQTRAAKKVALDQQRQSDFQFRTDVAGDKNWDPSRIAQQLDNEEQKKRKQQEDQRKQDEQKRSAPAVVGGFFKGIGDAIASPFKRVGEGTAEVVNEASGQAQKQRDQKSKQNADDIKMIKSLGERMKNAKTDEEKQRYRDALSKIMSISDKQNSEYQARQSQIIDRTDPIKGAAAVADVGLNVLTAGTVGSAAKGAKAALETGLTIEKGSKAAKVVEGAAKAVINPNTVKQGVVSGVTQGSIYGALGTAEDKGGTANIGDYAKGIGIGAVSGGVLGGATIKAIEKLSPLAQRVFNKTATQAQEKLGRNLTDNEAQTLVAHIEGATNPEKVTKQIPVVTETPQRMSSISTTKVLPDELKSTPAKAERTITTENLDRARLKTDPDYQKEVSDSIFASGKPTDENLLKEYRKIVGNVPGGSKDVPQLVEQAVEPKAYRNSSKELKTAIDSHIYETNPELFHREKTGRILGDGNSTDIPKMHVDDLKHYFGKEVDIPSTYKRTTGDRDIDKLAARAGYDSVDSFVEAIQNELNVRKGNRDASKQLAELRSNPDVIAEAQRRLDREKIAHGTEDQFTPSKKDESARIKATYGDEAKITKNKEASSPEDLGKEYKGNRQLRGDTTSGNSLRLEQNVLEKKLTDNLGDLAEYKSINMKDQAEKAIKLINEDKQKAIDIIDGKANPPGDLKAQSIHQALEDVAVQDGDVSLLQKLAKSYVNRELSESAQNLRIAAERDPSSAVENIRQLQETRKTVAEKRAGTTVEKEAAKIKEAVKSATPVPKKQDWASFVEELQCR